MHISTYSVVDYCCLYQDCLLWLDGV